MGDLVDFDGGRNRDRLRGRPDPPIAAWAWGVAGVLGIVLFALFTVWCECGPLR
jgi:hypothetical protein